MEDDPREPAPLVDPAALRAAAEQGALDRSRRAEHTPPPSAHAPRQTPMDAYGRPLGWSRRVFNWTNYAVLFSVVFFVLGIGLIGRHPVVAVIVLVLSSLNLAVWVASWRHGRKVRRGVQEHIARVESGRTGKN